MLSLWDDLAARKKKTARVKSPQQKAADTRRRNAQRARSLEKRRNEELGYTPPARSEAIPKDDPDADIRFFDIAVFQPTGRKRWPAKDVSDDIVERVNAKIPGAVIRKNTWQVRIRLPRKASTATIARLLAEVDFDGVNMQKGRVHFAVTTTEGEYLPISKGVAFMDDAIVDGVQSLLEDVMRYRSRQAEKE